MVFLAIGLVVGSLVGLCIWWEGRTARRILGESRYPDWDDQGILKVLLSIMRFSASV